jgi:hypothetical protein
MQIPYKCAWRAKEKAQEMIYGTDEESYELLPKYCEQIKESNPGSVAIVEWYPETHRFRRLFICYAASARGFAHCRPLIGLDGTHLTAKYRGILLTATAVDANGSLFPLAFGVVDVEDKDNWLWFLELLHQIISEHAPVHLVQLTKLVFLSDRQKGLIDGNYHLKLYIY